MTVHVVSLLASPTEADMDSWSDLEQRTGFLGSLSPPPLLSAPKKWGSKENAVDLTILC